MSSHRLRVADLVQAAQVLEARDVDAAFALDRLDEHRARRCGCARPTWRTASRSLSGTRTKPGHQRLEAGLHLAVAGGRQRGERAAVEGLLHDDDRRLVDALSWPYLRAILIAASLASQARVAEEHLVQAGDLGDAVGGRLLVRDAPEVRGVDHAATRCVGAGLR